MALTKRHVGSGDEIVSRVYPARWRRNTAASDHKCLLRFLPSQSKLPPCRLLKSYSYLSYEKSEEEIGLFIDTIMVMAPVMRHPFDNFPLYVDGHMFPCFARVCFRIWGSKVLLRPNFSLNYKTMLTKQLVTQVLSVDFKKTPVYFYLNFPVSFKILTALDRGENDVKDSLVYECNACVHGWINRQHGSFKLAFCINNKLHLHAEVLSQWVNDVTFPWDPIGRFWTWVMADPEIQNLHWK